MSYQNIDGNNITTKFIKDLSYSEFVGFINQWNVGPGAYVTINKWVNFSNINSNSNILEIGCTTGFSSREIATLTNCNGVGIDISKYAIKMANYNKEQYASDIKIKYINVDAYDFNPQVKFTHIIVGASLKFFHDPNGIMNRCIKTFLNTNGYILASPFYVEKRIPDNLLKLGEKTFGIVPTNIGYKEIMSLYNKLEILYEDRDNRILQETEEELKHYCKSTVDRTADFYNIDMGSRLYKTIYDRLYEIKTVTNLLRPYQKYSVLVLRYRKSIYPNRYVELF